jgi:CRP/FNR family transcriptional regulator
MKAFHINDFTSSINFFKTLDADLLADMLSHSSMQTFNQKEILFFEDDDVQKVYYLIDGSIKFNKVDRFDNEVFLYKLFGPKLIFDLSKLGSKPVVKCFANAEFDEDSTILAIDHEWFENNYLLNNQLMHNVMQESFNMVSQLQCIINRDVVFDGTAKVAHFLATDLHTYNRLKKHEIAYMLHIQPETLSRIIKKLARNEIITTEKSSIIINDLKRLKDIYE